MRGKEKCKILKQIRAEIAKNNDIEWITSECQHKGECKGTCPKCEAEVRQLERALETKRMMGQSVAVAGIAAGMALSVTGCALPNPVDGIKNLFQKPSVVQLQGDVEYIPDPDENIDSSEADIDSSEQNVDSSEEELLLDGDVVYIPEDEEGDFTEKRDNDYIENEQDNLAEDGSVSEGDE